MKMHQLNTKRSMKYLLLSTALLSACGTIEDSSIKADGNPCAINQGDGFFLMRFIEKEQLRTETMQKITQKIAGGQEDPAQEILDLSSAKAAKSSVKSILTASNNDESKEILRGIPSLGVILNALQLIRLNHTQAEGQCEATDDVAQYVDTKIENSLSGLDSVEWAYPKKLAKEKLARAQESVAALVRNVDQANHFYLSTKDDHEYAAKKILYQLEENAPIALKELRGVKDFLESDNTEEKVILPIAKPYVGLVDLSLYVIQNYLLAAKGLNSELLSSGLKDEIEAATSEVYSDTHEFIEEFEPFLTELGKKTSLNAASEVKFVCDDDCWTVDTKRWKVQLTGKLEVKVYNQENKTYDYSKGVDIDIVDILNLYPKEDQQYLPLKVKKDDNGSGNLEFDDPKAWPGKQSGSDWKAFHFLLGHDDMDAFWDDAFNQRDLHSVYFRKVDPAISSTLDPLTAPAYDAREAFRQLHGSLDSLKKSMSKCEPEKSYQSYASCETYGDPIMEAIMETVEEFE